jgi:hypothetical protein
MQAHGASHTAALVCQGRAAAQGRAAPGRFSDATATALLRDNRRVPVDRVRSGAPPQGRAERVEFEMVQAGAPPGRTAEWSLTLAHTARGLITPPIG